MSAVAQWLEALASVAEDRVLLPGRSPPLTPAPEDPTPSSDLRHMHTYVATHRHTETHT